MRNNLTFSGMFFLLLFVGKIGHIGTLAGMSWVVVFTPLAIDILFDFWAVMNRTYDLVGRTVLWLKMKQIHIAQKKNERRIKKQNS